MTQSDERENDDSQPDNSTDTQTGRTPYRVRIHRFIQARLGRKPAYRITRHGVEVEYFNFSNTDTLPFDPETYRDTQIFIGSWANPWEIDFENLEDSYDDFTTEEITTVDDVFEKEYIYPSQRWKILANQSVLQEMFVGRSLQQKTLQRLLYAVIGGLFILGVLIVFGGG